METAVQCRRRKIESRRSMRGALIETHDPSARSMDPRRSNFASWEERITMKIRPLSLATIVLALSLVATLSWAGTDQNVGSLLDDPGSYQSQVVRVTGTVYNHKIRRGVNKCFQLFTIEDEAGSIEAIYQANCSGAGNELRDRDFVTVEARFELTSSNSGMLKVQSIVSKVAPSAQ